MEDTAAAKSVRDELERVLASETFQRSERHRDLLRWIVERAQRDEPAAKEYEIGTTVLGRSSSWDPRIDPVVRIEFRRLRQRLFQFYETEDAASSHNGLRIQIAERGYGIEIVRVPEASAPASQPCEDREPFPISNEPGPTRPRPRRRFVGWIAAILIVAAAALLGTRYLRPRETAPAFTSVAVLPFVNTGSDAADDGLAYGFTDELTSSLATIPGFRVTARTSAFQFRGKAVDVREVGRQLNVGTVVEGSVQRAEDRTRIVVQLNRTSDGTHLWAQTFDSGSRNILEVEDEAARSIAAVIRSRVGDAQSLALTLEQGRFKVSRDAADDYLRGWAEFGKYTPQSFDVALNLFDRVIAQAPDFPEGYRGRAMARTTRSEYASDPRAESEIAIADLHRALELHTRMPGFVLANLAFLEYKINWDWPRAEAHLKESLSRGDTAYAQKIYGWGLITRGRIREGEQHLRQSVELDPLNDLNRIGVAEALIEASHFSSASEQAIEAVRQLPRWWLPQAISAQVDIYQDKPLDAIAKLEQIDQVERNTASSQIIRAAANAELKRDQEALDILKKLETGPSSSQASRFYVGVTYALLGDANQLFDHLNQSADRLEYEVLYAKIDPFLARRQSDPRMIQLLRRVRLTE